MDEMMRMQTKMTWANGISFAGMHDVLYMGRCASTTGGQTCEQPVYILRDGLWYSDNEEERVGKLTMAGILLR